MRIINGEVKKFVQKKKKEICSKLHSLNGRARIQTLRSGSTLSGIIL